MIDDNKIHEKIVSGKARIFLDENSLVHIKLFNGMFLNGRLIEVGDNFLKIKDRVEGDTKLFFIEIKLITEFMDLSND